MKVYKIKELCHLKKGKQIDTTLLNDSNPYKYINGGVKESGYYTLYNTEGEAVLISEGGASCGYVNYIDEKFWCGCHCYKLTDCKCLPKYLYYALKRNQNRLMELRTGAAMPNIKKATLQDMDLRLREDIAAQKEVVSNLDKLQSIISNRRQQLARFDDLIKSRFMEQFGNLNNTQYEVKTLEEICDIIKDGTHYTPTYTDEDSGVRFLSSKDVVTRYIDWTDSKFIPLELHKELHARIAPQKGDILLAKNGTTGICAIVDRDEVFDIYVSLALLRFKPGHNITYMWAAINMPETKRQFDERLKGIGVPNLHIGEIKQTRIIVPPLSLQEQFAAFVRQVDKSKFAIQKALRKGNYCLAA